MRLLVVRQLVHPESILQRYYDIYRCKRDNIPRKEVEQDLGKVRDIIFHPLVR